MAEFKADVTEGTICVEITVNGKTSKTPVDARTLLVDYIREALGLTGTHVGCDTGQCGCCTVLIDDDAVKSCTMLTVQAEGSDILTIEGLEKDGILHPLQQAFHEHHALQCGYCTPGFVLSALELITKYRDLDEPTVRRLLDGNMCRCTGYHNIVKAILSVANGRSEGGMAMYPFDYHRPASLADALTLVRERPDAKLLAGGMSLFSAMKLRLAAPSGRIDLSGINDLKGIVMSEDKVSIGSMVTHAAVASSADMTARLPVISALAFGIGDRQVRNRGTIGGSLANNDPAACYPAGVLGLGATIETNRRKIAADDYFIGMSETAFHPGEVITRVHFPVPVRAAYVKFHQAASRFALVGVLVGELRSGEIRVAVTGAGSCVFRCREVERELTTVFTPESAEAAEVPVKGLNSDIHGDAEYRAHLIPVLAARAVGKILMPDTA